MAPSREVGARQGHHGPLGAGDVHTHTQEAQATSPHAVHTAIPALQLEKPGDHPDPSQQRRASAAPPEQEGGRGGPRRQPSPGDHGDPPASFLPGKHTRLMQPRRNRPAGCWQDAAEPRQGGQRWQQPEPAPSIRGAGAASPLGRCFPTAALLRLSPALPVDSSSLSPGCSPSLSAREPSAQQGLS